MLWLLRINELVLLADNQAELHFWGVDYASCSCIRSAFPTLTLWPRMIENSQLQMFKNLVKRLLIFCSRGTNTLYSLAPGRFKVNLGWAIFKLILVVNGWGISCETALKWMSLDLTDDKSILVQVMIWCRQAASHYLSQCWPISLSPYGITRLQWVKCHLHKVSDNYGTQFTCIPTS